MSQPWMPFYVGDYLRDTRRLNAAEHGAYLLLIMEYWTAGSLPDDDSQLARIACMTPSEWKRSRPIVQAFFQDGWHHKRIDAELAKTSEKITKRKASGKAGGMAKAAKEASKRLANASDLPWQKPTNHNHNHSQTGSP